MGSQRSAPAKTAKTAKTARRKPPRDWLAEWVLEAGLPSEVGDALVGWLARELVTEQNARLEQGSHVVGGVPLRKVFIDLPISLRPVSMLETEGQDKRTYFLESLSGLTPRPLRCGDARDILELQDRETRRRGRAESQGYVIIGGPGQGKSTLGQLACQIHRAALLQPAQLQPGRLSESQRSALGPFLEARAKKSLGLPSAPLLPLRIVLPDATRWLLERDSAVETLLDPPPLLRYLAQALGQRVSVEALAALIRAAPVLLVLDALDEVGAQEDRALLLEALRGLTRFLGEQGARGLCVTTTRPQGYTGELARLGLGLQTVHLAPLRKDEALRYGNLLAETKLADRPEQRERVLRGLALAAEEKATARLLSTPLQVTILAALVERRGRAPKDRYGLFDRYFETIYEREIERNTYASPLLSDYHAQIRQLHARAGLLLQVEFEQGGGTEARLSSDRLRQIAAQILAEDGVDEETTAELLQRILRAAAERLVFLVEPEPGRFGFEIRSLQEFMAAEALATGEEERALRRLRQIAPASTFRAVTLFLASRAFSEAQPLRDSLARQVCAPLDEQMGDTSLVPLREGAMLALEILEEGSVLQQPRFGRQLVQVACGMLALPPGPEHQRLAAVASRLKFGASEADPLRAALEAQAAQGPATFPESSWVVLCALASLAVPWARALAERLWGQLDRADSIIEAHNWVVPPNWLAEKVAAEPEKVEPTSARLLSQGTGWLGAFMALVNIDNRSAPWTPLGGAAERWAPLRPLQATSGTWRLWGLAAEFATRPSAQGLAAVLRSVESTANEDNLRLLCASAPWPLAACLSGSSGTGELERTAAAAEAGQLGQSTDWLAAEKKWSREAPVSPLHPLPWDLSSLYQRAPMGALHHRWLAPFSTLSRLPDGLLRRDLAECWLLYATRAGRAAPVPAFAEVEPMLRRARFVGAELVAAAGRSPHRDEWLTGIAHLIQFSDLRIVFVSGPRSSVMADLLNSYEMQRESLAYLVLLRKAVAWLLDHGHSVDLDQLAEQFTALPPAEVDGGMLRFLLGIGGPKERHELLPRIAARAAEEPSIWGDFLAFAEDSLLPAAQVEAVLVQIFGRADLSWHLRRRTLEVLRGLARRRRSGLADGDTWSRLDLPLPRPEVIRPGHLGPLPPEQPVVLSRIELRNIRGIAELALELVSPAAGAGQWTLLLGPNGAGKTSILRAMVLALRDLKNPKIWPEGTFLTPWCSIGQSGRSSILVQTAAGSRAQVTISRNGSEAFFQDPRDRASVFPVFAYGCRRGSALGGAAKAVNTDEDDGPEIATLFSEGAGLVHAATWLIGWDGAAARNPAPAREGAIYDTILAALRSLLAVDEVRIEDRRVVVSGPGIGKDMPLEALSDGYLTTTGWFLDLVARWIDLAQRYRAPVPPDFLQRMTGLCLLDEIDLHLHPRWQIEIIPRVRQLLPRMSFVVTTHNPLTLVGCRPEEIWVLSREGESVRAARGTEVPMLLTGGQLYQRYFGIQDLYPSEIGEALRRYGVLASNPYRDDAEDGELAAIRQRLRDKGVDPGWEPAPRAPRPAGPAARVRQPKARPR